MRARCLLLVAALASVVSVNLAAPAGASIDSVSGQVTFLATAPPSVEIGALQSDTTMYAFNEQQCVALPSSLPVDITAPGTYDSTASLTPGTLAAGTVVSSQFVNADKVGKQKPFTDLTATIHTDQPIVGIEVLSHELNLSDFLGAPGTLYPTGDFGRGLELDNPLQNDFVIEEPDVHTVVIHSDVAVHTDQVRVITSCGGTIVVKKLTVPSTAPTTFAFTGDAAGTIGNGQTITVQNLAPGTYHSTEQVPFGWQLTSLTCDDGDSTGDLGTATATFRLEAGETVTCTFTDTSTERIGSQGLTPGYWKQPQHFFAWAGYTQSQSFDSVFGVTAFPSSVTLLQALGTGGGGVDALARQAVAALLNATSPTIAYPLYSWQVIQLVHDAIVSGNATTIESVKNQLSADNSLSG